MCQECEDLRKVIGEIEKALNKMSKKIEKGNVCKEDLESLYKLAVKINSLKTSLKIKNG
jgi:hypothetical protein